MDEKEFIHFSWVIGLVLITLIICGTLIWINYNSWTVRFEMDDNTKEAIESIDFEEINSDKIKCYEKKIVTERLFDVKEKTILLHGATYEEDIVEVNCEEYKPLEKEEKE